MTHPHAYFGQQYHYFIQSIHDKKLQEGLTFCQTYFLVSQKLTYASLDRAHWVCLTRAKLIHRA